MIKLVIFDWDDVIVLGSKKGYYDCYRETINDLGVNMTEEEMDIRIKSKWGKPFRIELTELLKEKPELIDKACEIFYQNKFETNTFLNALSEVEGVNEMLERLSKKYKLAVATGNQREMLNKIIAKFSIPNVFSQVITSHDNIPTEKTKPHPYMLEVILKEQGIKNTEAVYVGDAETDVLMARNAGVTPIVVLTGHLSKENAEKLGVKHIVHNVTQIEEILKEL
ncbi:MAG: HAD family hydrolase [Patescibacteria group bacterium]